MLLTWIRFFIIIKKVIGTILCARLGSLHELFTHLSASRSFHKSIISVLEFHCLPANTTRPNKNVYCFSSTATSFLLFPSSAIITFLLFFSAATRFLVFSFYHRNSSIVFLHHHYHHNSTVFQPPPPQFCCFPPPTPPLHLLFPCSFHHPLSITILLFSLHHHISISLLLFCHHHHMGRINFPPENRSALLSNFTAERLKYSRFFSYLSIENPSGLALEENWNPTVFERLKCVASFTSASQKPPCWLPSCFWLDDVKVNLHFNKNITLNHRK